MRANLYEALQASEQFCKDFGPVTSSLRSALENNDPINPNLVVEFIKLLETFEVSLGPFLQGDAELWRECNKNNLL